MDRVPKIFFFFGTPCWDCHACNVDDQQQGERNTCDCQIRKGSVIKSLGEDTRVAHVVVVLNERARMVAMSRRKRMVAHKYR